MPAHAQLAAMPLKGILLALITVASTPVSPTAMGQDAPPTKITKVAPAAEPVDLASGPQLFIDEYLIGEAKGVQKVTQHPQRFLDGPVLGWQQHTTQPYVTVLRDPDTGKFRLWYNHGSGKDCAIAYAESDDGIRWTTPNVGLLGPDNRLFVIGRSEEHGSYGVSVIDDRDSATDPSQRFKLMWWTGLEPAGVAIAWSPDGLQWKKYEKNSVLPYHPAGTPQAGIGTGDIVDLFYDPIRKHYASLFKLHGLESDGWVAGPRAGRAFRRLVGQSISKDFLNWSEPWRVIVPEPRDEGLLEFYSAGGTIARGPLLITFIRMLHDDYSPEPGGEPTGIGYTTLATSRDGESWERHDDIFFDRNPEPGTWDRAMTWVGSVIPVGEEHYLYYGGYKRGHKVEPTKERQIGLAKMPLDRFVAREATGDAPGTLVTVPLRVSGEGGQIVLNADASRGKIRVQVRDEGGEVVPGYSFDDCRPLTSDGVALPVPWKAGDKRAALDGKTISLEFELTNAKLFGFEMRPLKETGAGAMLGGGRE